MPDLSLPDVTLHYETEGSGPPLLLLAGMFSDGASWAPVVPLLTPDFTVIRPDNRSTGRTVVSDAAVDCAAMADDARALMDHLGHTTFHCVGHSLGGLLALELAFAYPERVMTTAVLASGYKRSARRVGLFDTLLAIRQAPMGEEMWLRALYPWVFGEDFFKAEGNVEAAVAAALAYPHAQTVENMARQIAAFNAFRPEAKIAEIACPALMLYGGQDVLVPPQSARDSLSTLPNAEHHTVPNAGHSIVWDAAEEVAGHLRNFLMTQSGTA